MLNKLVQFINALRMLGANSSIDLHKLMKISMYVAVAYFGTGYLGLKFSIFGDMVTLIWLPSGIAVAALFHYGIYAGVGVFLAASMATYSTSGNFSLAIAIAIGNTFAPIISSKFLHHSRFDPKVHSIKDLVNFIALGALVPMALSATNGVIALLFFGKISYSDIFTVWSHWWLGDVIGVLFCGFALITFKKLDWVDPISNRATSAAIRVLSFSALYFLYCIYYNSISVLGAFTLALPLIILISLAFRFGISVTAFAALLFGILGAISLANGYGPFVGDQLNHNLSEYWTYIGGITLVSAVVSILNSEKTSIIEKLVHSEARFKNLTNLSADWYWEMNTEFVVTRIDGNLSDALLDVSFEKVGEVRWARTCTVPTNDEWILHRSALESHLPFYELEIKRCVGSDDPIWISISGAPVFDENGIFSGYSGVGKDISARKNMEESLWKIAHHDRLTDLPNRRLFQIELERSIVDAKLNDTEFAVLLMDLDDFKSVNESLGHLHGDEILLQVSSRLSALCNERGRLFRMGGDEFAILVDVCSNRDILKSMANEILAQVSEAYQLKTEIAHLTVSIGIATFPKDRSNAVSLMSVVDQAMYEAKKSGKSCYFFFSEELDLQLKRNQWLIREMHIGISQNHFSVVYQPIIDLGSGIACKAEALIRWNHPSVGAISPAEFIPIAEASGLILQIGDWVFDEAVKACKDIRNKHSRNFQISVNKSPVQIGNADPKRCGWMARILELDAEPNSIVVEITEGVLLQSNSIVKKKLEAFKEMGMHIALDDFGTGYSSLSYLQQHDIDYVKIDRAFIMNIQRNIKSKVLCEAIIAMAHKLDMKVVAEGVETLDQVKLLTEMSCDFAQGYFFSKPLTLDNLSMFLAQQESIDCT